MGGCVVYTLPLARVQGLGHLVSAAQACGTMRGETAVIGRRQKLEPADAVAAEILLHHRADDST